jgi:hypothetical protein
MEELIFRFLIGGTLVSAFALGRIDIYAQHQC